MSVFQLTWRIKEQQEGMVLREFLKEQHISKAALADIKFKGGRIQVNGYEETVRYLLQYKDIVNVQFPIEQTSEGLLPEDLPLQIVYEDEYVLIINKPPFTNTIPSREHPTGSIANRIAGYYKRMNIASTVHIVTRLDRDTSGLMLIAKHRHVHHLLSEQQKKGEVSRTYEAFVHGHLYEVGKVEAPIGRKATSIIEREVRDDGQYACTLYQSNAVYDQFSHIQLHLLTGRTHQIRVHMSYIGHPLLGDDLYGGSLDFINRQALHCKQVTFYHPFKEETLTFQADLLEDMKKLIE
ncbi:RluA family pseudouridine synthase [Bacillus sp. JJ722]|uniref:RluA family pseudouridine synthase n=1 Tax=Bacillus sp. JJ722 TaxID=3122973 RepID=UPI002FFF903B